MNFEGSTKYLPEVSLVNILRILNERWAGTLGTTYPSGDVNILTAEPTSRE